MYCTQYMESRRNFATLGSPLFSEWCCVKLASEKQQLHAQQRRERAELLAALDQLQATHRKELEEYRGQARKKALTQEITRDRRYHEEKSVWEYLNNIVEVIHLYTWKKTVIAICCANYQQQYRQLEQECRELEAQHRKERIALRYDLPVNRDESGEDMSATDLHVFQP